MVVSEAARRQLLSRRDLLRVAAVGGGTLLFSGAAMLSAAGFADADATELKVSGWGGCDAVKERGFDRLTLEIVATGGDPVPLAKLQVFDRAYTVDGPLLRRPDGLPVPYHADGAFGI